MKYISIITGSDLQQVQGVNYFIKSFIQCNEEFKDVTVNRVYSGIQTLKVDEGGKMPIGADLGTAEYKRRRGIRTFLRKLLTDKFYPFRLFRYQLNLKFVSRGSCERFFADKVPCDYIIFQETGCAEYYFNHLAQHPERKGIKTILIMHTEDDTGNMLLDTFKGYGRRDMQRRLYKMRDFVYERIGKVMYISQKAYNASIQPVEKRAFVYNGSQDVEYTFPEEKNEKVQFVCVGSIDGRKGQDKILEAMHLMGEPHLKRMHVTFVGDGNLGKETRALAKTLCLEEYVTFTGRRNDVPDILGKMDVFVMPSTVEGLPMSAIEAMRAGLYLILTDTGGNAELCADSCGLVCSRKPEDILSKMYAAMDGNVLNKEQKAHSRLRYLKNFSLKSMAKGYENALMEL